MDKEEFLKEHPSLCMNKSAGSTNNVPTFDAVDIHETQLDKKIVKMAIESNLPPSINKEELKEELGLTD